MKEQLEKIKNQFEAEIPQANSSDLIEKIRIKYLGRKSELTNILRNIKNLSSDQRREIGRLANQINQQISTAIKNKESSFNKSKDDEQIDATLPGHKQKIGHYHPLTLFQRKVNLIFSSMGFEIVDGPEVELAKYNFDLLNIPRDHPARDQWDTFYVTSGKTIQVKKDPGNELLMRTHTSPVQIRTMLERRPPVRLIVPGRVFRHEATDASHESMFYQCEGLVIDRGVRVTDLISTLKAFLQQVYGERVEIRVRPEYYPFVEPGLDIDMKCILCEGKGCSVCKQRGWLEMLGSGMVHPQVLKNMKIDPNKYSGFAFGLGIDRLMMLYYGIRDIRLSYQGDLRFNNQF